MLVDRRELEFDGDALVHCLAVSPRAAEGFGLPPKAPSGVRFHPKEGMIDVVYGRGNEMGAVRIAAASLGALLISYCVRTRIPMPKVSDKAIRVESSAVILSFRTQLTRSPTPEVPENSSRAVEGVKSWKWIEPELSRRLP